MLKLKLKKRIPEEDDNAFLAMPDAEPLTLYEIPGDTLPYACQCPLCGGVFQIPTGVLYRVDEDTEEDTEEEEILDEDVGEELEPKLDTEPQPKAEPTIEEE